MGLPPSTRGVVEPSFVDWAADFKAELSRRYGQPLSTANGTVATAPDAGAEPRPGLVLDMPGGCATLDTLILREDLARGQRVAAYVLEYLPCGAKPAAAYRELGSGSTIGAKRVFPLVYGNNSHGR
jgi:hypothetical protein